MSRKDRKSLVIILGLPESIRFEKNPLYDRLITFGPSSEQNPPSDRPEKKVGMWDEWYDRRVVISSQIYESILKDIWPDWDRCYHLNIAVYPENLDMYWEYVVRPLLNYSVDLELNVIVWLFNDPVTPLSGPQLFFEDDENVNHPVYLTGVPFEASPFCGEHVWRGTFEPSMRSTTQTGVPAKKAVSTDRSWVCHACTIRNENISGRCKNCVMCKTPKITPVPSSEVI